MGAIGSILASLLKGMLDWFCGKRKEKELIDKTTEAEALKGRAQSVEDANKLENEIRDKQREVKENEDKKQSNPDDVLDSDNWNQQ